MAEATTTRSFRGLPAGPLSAVALAELQFDQALRGYRMDQVDEVIDALSTRVRELESQVTPFEPEVAPLEPEVALLEPEVAPLEPEVAPLEERRQE